MRSACSRAVAAIVVPLLALLALASPALDMRLGLPNDGTEDPDTTQRQAYDLLSEGFGPGFNGPLTVVADLDRAGDRARAAAAVPAEVRGLDDVAAVAPARMNPAGDLAIVALTPRSGPSSSDTETLVDAIRARGPAIEQRTGATIGVTGKTPINTGSARARGWSRRPG